MYNYQNPYWGYQFPQYTNQQTQINQSVTSTLNGKVVDSVDVVKSQEVPLGSYGVFPLGDLSKIYIKRWCNDGTTIVDEYLKSTPLPISQEEVKSNNEVILQKLELLTRKIDALQNPNSRKRKVEVATDE